MLRQQFDLAQLTFWELDIIFLYFFGKYDLKILLRNYKAEIFINFMYYF